MLQLSTPVGFFTSTNIVTVKKFVTATNVLSCQHTLLQQRSVTPKVHHTNRVLTQQKKKLSIQHIICHLSKGSSYQQRFVTPWECCYSNKGLSLSKINHTTKVCHITVLILQAKLQNLLHHVVKDSKKKGRNLNCKESRIYGCQQEKHPKMQTRNWKYQKFKYLWIF